MASSPETKHLPGMRLLNKKTILSVELVNQDMEL
jgi:hypothetical protein